LNFEINTVRLTQLHVWCTCYIFIRNNECLKVSVRQRAVEHATVLNDVRPTLWTQTEPRSWFYIINELSIVSIIGL